MNAIVNLIVSGFAIYGVVHAAKHPAVKRQIKKYLNDD